MVFDSQNKYNLLQFNSRSAVVGITQIVSGAENKMKLTIKPKRQRFLSLGLGVLLLCLLQACGQESLTDIEYLNRGKQSFDSKDYKSTVVQLKNALQQNGANAEARWLLAKTYLILGDGASAEKEFIKTRDSGVPESELELSIVRSILLQREFHKILDRYEDKALVGSPARKSTLLNYIGHAHFELKAFEQAEAKFQEAYETDKSNALATLGMAKMAVAKGNAEEARGLLDEAKGQAGQKAEAWVAIGKQYSNLRSYSEAEFAYKKVLDIETSNTLTYFSSQALMGIIRVQLAQKKVEEAKSYHAKLEKQNGKHFFVVYFRGYIAFREGRYTDSLSAFQLVEKNRRDFMPNIFMLGVVNMALDNDKQASVYLSRFLEARPNFIPAKVAMASLELKLNNPEQALDILGGAAKINDSSELFSLMADASVQLGELNEGANFVRKAIDKDPEEQKLKVKLASSELLLNKPKKAIEIIQANFSKDDKVFPAALVEINAYIQLKDYKNALQKTDELIARQPENDARGYNLRGAIYSLQGDLDQAKKDFESAIEKDGEFASAWLNLGKLAEKSKDLSAAKKHFEKAISINASFDEAMVALARVLETEGRYSESVRWLEKAREANKNAIQPRILLARHFVANKKMDELERLSQELEGISKINPESLKLKASVLASKGEFEESYTLYQRVYERTPTLDHLFLVAKAQMRLEKTSEARKSLAKILKKEPNNNGANALMATLDVQAGKFDRALKRAKTLQKNKPDSGTGFLMAGDIYIETKKYAKAVSSYDQAYKLLPAAEVIQKKFKALILNGQDDEAEATIEAWIKDNPNDFDSRLILAVFFEEHGKLEGAQAHYEYILENVRDHYIAQNQMALILQKRGKKDEALALAEKAYSNSGQQVAMMDTYGWLLVKTGNVNRGLNLLEKALEISPDNKDILYHYAYALNEIGQSSKAKKIVTDILASDDVGFSERNNAQALKDTL